MDASQIPLMAALHGQMQYASARHGVIAQNIANVNTPNYIPHDLKAPSFAEMLSGGGAGQGVAMWRTDPRHMSGSHAAGSYAMIERTNTGQHSLNGNQVSLEQETQQMAMNEDDYTTAV